MELSNILRSKPAAPRPLTALVLRASPDYAVRSLALEESGLVLFLAFLIMDGARHLLTLEDKLMPELGEDTDVAAFEALAFSADMLRRFYNPLPDRQSKDYEERIERYDTRYCEPMCEAFPMAFTYVADTAARLGGWNAQAIWHERVRTYRRDPSLRSATETFNANFIAATFEREPLAKYLPDLSDPIRAVKLTTSGIAFVSAMPAAYAEVIENVVDEYSLLD